MRQRVHTGGGGQPFGHARHHIGVDKRNNGNVVHVYANHFAVLFRVGNDIVNGNFRGGTGGCRHGKNRFCFVFGRRNTLKAADIIKFRVRRDNTDRLSGVHRAAAADRNQIIRAGGFESVHAVLAVFNGGVGFNIGINFISQPFAVENVRNLFGHTEFQKVRVRADKCFLKTAANRFVSNVCDCALAMIGSFVQYKSVCHIHRSF